MPKRKPKPRPTLAPTIHQPPPPKPRPSPTPKPKPRSKPPTRPGEFVGTDEQEEIWFSMIRGRTHMIANALAGCGKTATMVRGLAQDRTASIRGKRRAMTVFGKANALELESKAPRDVVTGTLHKLMNRVVRDHFPQIPRPLFDKVRALLDREFPNRRFPRGGRANVYKLVDLAKNTGITLDEIANPTGHLRDLIIRHSISSKLSEADLISTANRVLASSADPDLFADYSIDFEDMIWLPYALNLKPRQQFDELVVDECQDLNVVQQYDAISLGKRLILIGDEFQAIFGFRGAGTNAIQEMKNKLGDIREYPLTICWRCPESVLALAQNIVPTIRPRPGAPLGDVLERTPEEVEDLVRPGDMALCRTNAPLVAFAFRLWAKGVRAFIVGRRYGTDLLSIVTEEEFTGITLDRLRGALQDRLYREESRLSALPNTATQIANLQDKYACLFNLIDTSDSVPDLKSRLDYLFPEDGTPDLTQHVRLSSVHRAKGLEAENVYILEPHLLPHHLAQQQWEIDQEYNIAYIAATRAQTTLTFAGQIPRILTQPRTSDTDWQNEE